VVQTFSNENTVSDFQRYLCGETALLGLTSSFEEVTSENRENAHEVIELPYSLTRIKMIYELHYWNKVIPNSKLYEYKVSDGSRQHCYWRVVIGSSHHGLLIGTTEFPIYEPLFSLGSSNEFKSKVNSVIFTALSRVLMLHSISNATYTSFFPNTLDLTDWQVKIQKTGAECIVKYDLYVDLSRSIEDLWSSIRKSYKSLINKGKKLWDIEIIDQPNVGKLDEFKELHAKAAGRITRSESTWRTQLEMIRQGNAFMIQVRSMEKDLIGCALFAHNNYEAVYFSAAIDKHQTKLPINHAIQWQAICELKRRGVKWYNLGEFYFPKDSTLSEKEENITFFKTGFNTDLHRRYIYIYRKP
jgi:FemAB family protein